MASEWIVLLEAVRKQSSCAVDGDALSRMLQALEHAQAVGLHSRDRYAVQLRLAAGNPMEALASALSAWSQALSTAGVPPWELVRAEVMTREELDYELEVAGAAAAASNGSGDELLNAAFADVVAGLTVEHGPLGGCGLNCDLRWRLMLGGSTETLTLLSAEGSVVFSLAPEAAKPVVAEDALGRSFVDEVHPDDAEAVTDALAAVVAAPGKPVSFVARFRCHDEWYWYESMATNLLDEPLVGAIVVNSRDVTESKRLQERLADMAERDELTGLVNRTIFLDQLELALARSTVASHLAVFFVDIIDFRGFVARHGPEVGDQMLLSVAERLRSDIYEHTTAARLGGDEFALLCEDVPSSTEAAEIARRIGNVVSAPIRVGTDEFQAGVTIGVALGTLGMLQPATLLRHAEVAMYRARRGQAHYDIYGKRRQSRSNSDMPPY